MTKEERKEYQRNWQKENREKNLEYQRNYRDSNKEKCKEYTKRSYKKHREKKLIHQKEYNKLNKETLKTKNKIYRELNKEKLKIKNKIYRELNKDKINTDKSRESSRTYWRKRYDEDKIFRDNQTIRSKEYNQGKHKYSLTESEFIQFKQDIQIYTNKELAVIMDISPACISRLKYDY